MISLEVFEKICVMLFPIVYGLVGYAGLWKCEKLEL